MRKNKLKELFKAGKPIINSWLAIPSSFSAEVMANQGWDSITIDMQHGLIDYPNAVNMLKQFLQQMQRLWRESTGMSLDKS